MWPTLVNRHNACCQRPISAASAAAPSGLAARHCVRIESSSSDGSRSLSFESSSIRHSRPRYFAFKPCVFATAVIVAASLRDADFEFRSDSAMASVAARYFSTARRPPLFVSKTIPCRFTFVPPVSAENSWYKSRIRASVSLVQSLRFCDGENRKPSGSSTAF
ncbi:MAG: hypothetical protein FD138_1815 [Planctomycetota bacterium]|nr:MAG: hypothetical protein FD138_1815 [Planctomycetota bacterium]